jgi:hypothetical protein
MTLVALGALALGASSHLVAQAPAGATAKCGDGTYSHAKNKQGACSNHGGVAEWMGGGEVASANAGLPAGAPGDATAICNDNTYSNSQHRSGTCSHHGGVKKWLKDVPN